MALIPIFLISKLRPTAITGSKPESAILAQWPPLPAPLPQSSPITASTALFGPPCRRQLLGKLAGGAGQGQPSPPPAPQSSPAEHPMAGQR